ITSLKEFEGKNVAVFGGGDSALDWSLMLEKVAKNVHLVHRRTAFRGHEITVDRVMNSNIQVHTPYTFSNLIENELELKKIKSEESLNFSIDKILVNYGFLTNQVTLAENLEVSRNGRVKADSMMQSNIEGLYVAGDASDYPGKMPLMSVGFGEAVHAINAMTKKLEFDHPLRGGHSSSIF
ncbi:MAG: NAD(P)/FAD-dependent oxidoreductase, partial [Lactococcus lactis]|nr:NAD(P)/FAD-dependent oxidoreductase [Lactococcus lactis]